jgi:hypothetical protein
VSQYLKVIENCIWLIANAGIGSFVVVENAVVKMKIFLLISNVLRTIEEITVELWQVIEYLLSTVQDQFSDTWCKEFEVFFNVINGFIETYLE